MGRAGDRARAVSRERIPTPDGGARRRRQPRGGAPRVRTVPTAPRRGARRLPVPGDRVDLPRAPRSGRLRRRELRDPEAAPTETGDHERAALQTGVDGQSSLHGRGAIVALAAGACSRPRLVTLVLAVGRGGSSGGSGVASASRVSARTRSRPSTRRSAPVGSAPLEASPSAIAYGEGSVWVTMPNQDSVSRIDPKTNTVQQTIGAGNGPTGIARRRRLRLGREQPRRHGLADRPASERRPGRRQDRGRKRPDRQSRMDSAGSGWRTRSTARSSGSTRSRTSREAHPGRRGADAIAVGDGAVWVTSKSAGVLSRIDPASGSVTPINVGNGPVAVAAGPRAVWVANSQDATVWRVDPATNRVVGTVTVGEGPSGVAVGSSGTERLGLERALRHALADRPGGRQGCRDASRSATSRRASPRARTTPMSPSEGSGGAPIAAAR